MRRPTVFVGVALFCFFEATVLPSATPRGQERWPEFRGPSANGHAPTAKLPEKVDQDCIRWQTPIHGRGWSSPVVWGRQIWVTSATTDGKELYAVCVDLQSGDVLHDILLGKPEDPGGCHATNSYATPTPVICDNRVYLHFGRNGTYCLDSQSGEQIWSRTDFQCDHFRGAASSPILYDNKIYVAFDGIDQQYVVSLNASTGQTIWKKDREISYGTEVGDRKKAYGTGRVIQIDDQPQLVYPAAAATIAYRPSSGDMIWKVYHGDINVSARPVLSPGGLLVFALGEGAMAGIDPGGQGDVSKTHLVWKIKKNVPKHSSQIIVDRMLYMANERGVLSCIDPETGQAIWHERVGGSFSASPIAANSRIYFFDTAGKIYVIRASNKFDLVSQTKIGDGFLASPAVADNCLVLRSRSHLYCIENRTE